MKRGTLLCTCLLLAAVPGWAQRQVSLTKLSIDPNANAETEAAKPLKAFRMTGTFQEAIEALQKETRATLVADWEALEAAGVSAKDGVMLKGRNLTIGDLVELLLVQLSRPGKPLGYVAKHQFIVLTTQERALEIRRRKPAPAKAGATPKAAPTAGKAGAAKAKTASDGPAPAVERLLDRPLQHGRSGRPRIRVVDVEFGRVVSAFARVAEVNIHVNWKALEAVDVSRTTSVDLDLEGVSVARALDVMLDQLNVGKDRYDSIYWVIDRGIVQVTTGEELDKTMRTEIHDVSQILHVEAFAQVPLFFGGPGDPREGGAARRGGPNEHVGRPRYSGNPSDVRNFRMQLLKSIIESTIGEEMWQPQGKGSITFINRQMIVTQSLLGFKLMEKAAASSAATEGAPR